MSAVRVQLRQPGGPRRAPSDTAPDARRGQGAHVQAVREGVPGEAGFAETVRAFQAVFNATR